MNNLRALYIMAFTPEKLDDHALMMASRSAADALAKRDVAFTRKMGMVEQNTRITFSGRTFLPTTHTPRAMQADLGQWMKDENVHFAPTLGDDLFLHRMRDSAGREQYFLFYFHIQ